MIIVCCIHLIKGLKLLVGAAIFFVKPSSANAQKINLEIYNDQCCWSVVVYRRITYFTYMLQQGINVV